MKRIIFALGVAAAISGCAVHTYDHGYYDRYGYYHPGYYDRRAYYHHGYYDRYGYYHRGY